MSILFSKSIIHVRVSCVLRGVIYPCARRIEFPSYYCASGTVMPAGGEYNIWSPGMSSGPMINRFCSSNAGVMTISSTCNVIGGIK